MVNKNINLVFIKGIVDLIYNFIQNFDKKNFLLVNKDIYLTIKGSFSFLSNRIERGMYNLLNKEIRIDHKGKKTWQITDKMERRILKSNFNLMLKFESCDKTLGQAIDDILNKEEITAQSRANLFSVDSDTLARRNLALIKAKADVNAKINNSWAILNYMAERGNEPMVKKLICEKVDVNSFHNQTYPIVTAAHNGHTAVVELLFAAKANINSISLMPRKQTPLFSALIANRQETIKFLIEKKADLSINCEDPVFNSYCPVEGVTSWDLIKKSENAEFIWAIEKSKNTPGPYPPKGSKMKKGITVVPRLLNVISQRRLQ